MSRRAMGRCLVGAGIIVLLWGVLDFTSASIGGPPDDLHFANRRPYNEVKRAAHNAFLPLVLRTAVGLGVLLLGARIQSREGGEAQD